LPDGRHFPRIVAGLAWLDAPWPVIQIPIRTRDDDGPYAPQGNTYGLQAVHTVYAGLIGSVVTPVVRGTH